MLGMRLFCREGVAKMADAQGKHTGSVSAQVPNTFPQKSAQQHNAAHRLLTRQ